MNANTANCYSGKLTPLQIQSLRNALSQRQQWEPYEVPYAEYAFRGEDVSVVVYKSGKICVQGKKTQEFVQFILEPEVLGEIVTGYEEQRYPEWFIEHGGLDESGKGDFFGPLVSACVIAGGESVKQWLNINVRDSKNIHSSQEIFSLEKKIRQTPNVVVETFSLSMRKYNELYGKFGNNLNHLLAWYHAKSLQNAREKNAVFNVLLDQFSTAPLVQRFFANDPKIHITMRPRAENDPVVAAASIVARAEYLRAMKNLSDLAKEELFRGASDAVIQQAKRIIGRFGVERLADFAKLHFSTAQRAIYS
jgi:ribonuclease HIII